MNLEEKSYIYGLLGTDGSLSLSERNRGKITLEVNSKDNDIIEKLYHLIPNSTMRERTRNTNFKENYTTAIFSNYQLEFRQEMIAFGLPITDKTNMIGPPIQKYSKRDFWRGVIDGDGSLGFTGQGKPFVSLVTKSENLKVAYCNFLLEEFGIIKEISRNKRDNVYNIMVSNEEAQSLCRYLYNGAALYLDRKYNKALEILDWHRPEGSRKMSHRLWTKEEEDFLLTHTLEESCNMLNRTKSAIKSHLYKIKSK